MTEIVTTQTPPILQGPSEKERKYDRQLRLWAASGQAALESANILLFNTGSGAVGVETLKNLVLPGTAMLPPLWFTTIMLTVCHSMQELEASPLSMIPLSRKLILASTSS